MSNKNVYLNKKMVSIDNNFFCLPLANTISVKISYQQGNDVKATSSITINDNQPLSQLKAQIKENISKKTLLNGVDSSKLTLFLTTDSGRSELGDEQGSETLKTLRIKTGSLVIVQIPVADTGSPNAPPPANPSPSDQTSSSETQNLPLSQPSHAISLTPKIGTIEKELSIDPPTTNIGFLKVIYQYGNSKKTIHHIPYHPEYSLKDLKENLLKESTQLFKNLKSLDFSRVKIFVEKSSGNLHEFTEPENSTLAECGLQNGSILIVSITDNSPTSQDFLSTLTDQNVEDETNVPDEIIEQKPKALSSSPQAPKTEQGKRINLEVIYIGKKTIHIPYHPESSLKDLKESLLKEKTQQFESLKSLDFSRAKIFVKKSSGNLHEFTEPENSTLAECGLKDGSTLIVSITGNSPSSQGFLSTSSGKAISAIGFVAAAGLIYTLIKKYKKRHTTNALTSEQQKIVEKLIAILSSPLSFDEQEQAQAVLFSSYNYSEAEQQALVNVALSHCKQPN